MLVIDNPEEGIDLLFRSFDVARTVSIAEQRNIAFYINTYVGLSLDEIYHEKYINKCLIILYLKLGLVRTLNSKEMG